MYAYEGFRERGSVNPLKEVVTDQYYPLEKIADELIGFRQAAWTRKRARFFKKFFDPESHKARPKS